MKVADDHLRLVVTANFRGADEDVPRLGLLDALLAGPALVQNFNDMKAARQSGWD